jgi:hypothetical protein
MGLPTYEYPPSSYPMPVKYTDKGQCTQCGYKNILKEDGFICKICNCKMHAGVEVNSKIYFHGEKNSNNRINESNDSIREHLTNKNKQKTMRNLISVFAYPPQKFPMKATYLKRNGVCVHCKNKIINSDTNLQCSKCKINLCCGVEFKNVVYYHGRIYNDDRSLNLNFIPDTDSSVHFSKRICHSKKCFISLLVLIFVILILIIIFVYLSRG